jgi:hypothetical protein
MLSHVGSAGATSHQTTAGTHAAHSGFSQLANR